MQKCINFAGVNIKGNCYRAYYQNENEREMQIQASQTVEFKESWKDDYTRSGSTTQELKGGALQRLLLKANNLSWDEIEVGNADYGDIDRDLKKLVSLGVIEMTGTSKETINYNLVGS